jgi:hypothetical protein
MDKKLVVLRSECSFDFEQCTLEKEVKEWME